jgi:hypothetical protein
LQQNMAARLDEDDFDIEEFEVIKISSLISWWNGHLPGNDWCDCNTQVANFVLISLTQIISLSFISTVGQQGSTRKTEG